MEFKKIRQLSQGSKGITLNPELLEQIESDVGDTLLIRVGKSPQGNKHLILEKINNVLGEDEVVNDDTNN